MRSKQWYARPGKITPPARWYRVQHRTAGDVRSLGLLADVAPHQATLAPFASRLVQVGAGGELVLVEASTGTEVARQDVTAGPRRGPARTPAEGFRGHGRGERVVRYYRSRHVPDRNVVIATRESTSGSGESWSHAD